MKELFFSYYKIITTALKTFLKLFSMFKNLFIFYDANILENLEIFSKLLFEVPWNSSKILIAQTQQKYLKN